MMPLVPLLALAGVQIAPTFTAGPVLYVGRPDLIRAHARVRLGAGSTAGGIVCKFQGSKDASDPAAWEDLASRRDDTGAVAPELELTLPQGVTSGSFGFGADVRGYLAVRILARGLSGTGQSGDEIQVDGVTW